jgi:hypothetical protein
MTMPPPNWYTDPADARVQRWWSGQDWTEHTRAAAPTGLPSPFAAADPYSIAGPASTPLKAADRDRQARQLNGVGYAGAVLAIISLLFNFFGLLSVLAIILSSVGLSKALKLRALGHRVTGRGWCIAGLVIGIVETLSYLGRFVW